MRIRQAWLMSLLEWQMRVGKGHNLVNSMVYNAYSLSSAGHTLLQTPHKLPSVEMKGCKAITTIRSLMSSSEKWFPISSETDYHFPGIFSHPYSQRLGFCVDISILSQYDSTNPHFLFTDIQIGKGKAHNTQTVSMKVRSVKRVSERINKGNPLANKAFTTIAYNVTNMTSTKDVRLLFDVHVLAGK